MKAGDIQKVVIIGAGTKGQQIGFLCAMNGFDITLYDISADFLAAR